VKFYLFHGLAALRTRKSADIRNKDFLGQYQPATQPAQVFIIEIYLNAGKHDCDLFAQALLVRCNTAIMVAERRRGIMAYARSSGR
jgi:hypothetical protein